MGELFDRLRPSAPLEWTGERLTTGTQGQVEVEHLHRYFVARHLCRGLDVLDIASGEGYGSALMAQTARSVVGVELDPASLDHARRSYALENLRFEAGDARAIPLPDAAVDCVVSFETIEHFYEHELFVREVKRVLRPDGVFIVSSPERDIYSPQQGPSNPYHVRELTKAELAELLRSSFRHLSLHGQRPVVGSVIVADAAAGPAPETWTFERRAGERFEASSGLARICYWIAVASDSAACPALNSVYVESGDVDAIVHLPVLRQTLAQTQDRLAIAARETVAAGEANGRLTAQLAEARQLAAGREEQLRHHDATIAALQAQAEAAARQEQVARAEADRLRSEWSRELGRLRTSIEQLQQERNGLRERQFAAIEEVEQLRAAHDDERRKAAADLVAERSRALLAEEGEAAVRRSIRDLEANLSRRERDADAALRNARTESQTHLRQVDALRSRLQDLTAEMEQCRADLDESHKRAAALSAQIAPDEPSGWQRMRRSVGEIITKRGAGLRREPPPPEAAPATPEPVSPSDPADDEATPAARATASLSL